MGRIPSEADPLLRPVHLLAPADRPLVLHQLRAPVRRTDAGHGRRPVLGLRRPGRRQGAAGVDTRTTVVRAPVLPWRLVDDPRSGAPGCARRPESAPPDTPVTPPAPARPGAAGAPPGCRRGRRGTPGGVAAGRVGGVRTRPRERPPEGAKGLHVLGPSGLAPRGRLRVLPPDCAPFRAEKT
jgi:hypothetical protein